MAQTGRYRRKGMSEEDILHTDTELLQQYEQMGRRRTFLQKKVYFFSCRFSVPHQVAFPDAGDHTRTTSDHHTDAPMGVAHDVSLENVLAYENRGVVDRFLKLYDVSEDEADLLFKETLKFLWACSRCRHQLAPVTIIDEMWHNFILFTPDYRAFCRQHFERFIHHNPADDASREESAAMARADGYESTLDRQLHSLCELLGEKTVYLWYVLFPKYYDEQFFRSRAKLPNIRQPEVPRTLLEMFEDAPT